jgi:hypothetical protein
MTVFVVEFGSEIIGIYLHEVAAYAKLSALVMAIEQPYADLYAVAEHDVIEAAK